MMTGLLQKLKEESSQETSWDNNDGVPNIAPDIEVDDAYDRGVLDGRIEYARQITEMLRKHNGNPQ